MRCSRAQVRTQQCAFEIIERVAVNFLAERNRFLNPLAQVFARARDCLLHALEEASFFVAFGAAEQSWGHEKWGTNLIIEVEAERDFAAS